MAGSIISLGSINVDVQVRTDRWPEPGETLVARSFLLLGGGKAANVAFLARRLGAPALLIGRVGDDVLAQLALEPLVHAGVDVGQVRKVTGTSTAVSLITVRADGDKAIVLAANANDGWDSRDGQRTAQAIARAPRGSLLVADAEISGTGVQEAVAAAKQHQIPVLLDPSPAGRVTEELLRSTDYVTPNPPEAHSLTGVEVRTPADAEQAGQRLLERGVRAAFMKLAGGGCVAVTRDGANYLRAPSVPVVDKTGAGDAFAGALAVALLEGKDSVEAGRFAVAAASCAVTGWGSQPSYPTREQIEHLLR